MANECTDTRNEWVVVYQCSIVRYDEVPMYSCTMMLITDNLKNRIAPMVRTNVVSAVRLNNIYNGEVLKYFADRFNDSPLSSKIECGSHPI